MRVLKTRRITYEECENLGKYSTKQKIRILKEKLSQYDYIGTKIATGRATKEEYAKEIAQMTAWADEINRLEGEKQ